MRTRKIDFLVIERWNYVCTSVSFDNPNLKRWLYAYWERQSLNISFLTFLSTSVCWIFESNVRQYLQRKTILQPHTIFYSVTLSRFSLAWRTFSILFLFFSRILPTLLVVSSTNSFSPLSNILLTDNKSSKLLKRIMMKCTNNYKYHHCFLQY